jgi:hypothetical protein
MQRKVPSDMCCWLLFSQDTFPEDVSFVVGIENRKLDQGIAPQPLENR